MGLEMMNVTLAFTIPDASPELQSWNIQWTFVDVDKTHFNIPTDRDMAIFSDLAGLFSDNRLSLTLMNLTDRYEGTYVVTATNEVGTASASLALIFKGQFRNTLETYSTLVNDVHTVRYTSL